MKLKNCNRCSLSETRDKVVVGRGSLDAKVVFIGEAPGQAKSKTGIPFIGQAGKMFDKIVKAIGLEENDFYVTNVIKCIPLRQNGKNGKPTVEQIVKCGKWLNIQLNRIKPNIIVTLGGYAKNRVLDLPGPIGKYVGKSFVSEIYNVVFVMYHPATLLYNKKEYLPKFKRHIADLKKLMAELDVDNSNYWKEIKPTEGLKRIWQKPQIIKTEF